MIPMDNAEKIGVREVISEKEADSFLEEFRKIPAENDSNWNKRYRENLMHIKNV